MFADYLDKTMAAFARLRGEPGYKQAFDRIADILCAALAADRKVLFAGNGGSAADCQHLAGELVVRFRSGVRRALPAVALTVDTSVLTAALNDFGVDAVFSRQVEALGREGDVLWAFSTSGNSANIVAACRAALDRGMLVVAFTAEGGGELAAMATVAFRAPSPVTSHAQECHIAVGHMLCDEVEERLFGGGK